MCHTRMLNGEEAASLALLTTEETDLAWNQTMTSQGQCSVVWLLAVAACAGPTATGPLEVRVSDSHLAPVPIADREQIADLHRAAFLSEWQIKYTEVELRDAKVQVSVAGNELAAAKLSAKSALERRKRADALANMGRIRDATRDETLASLETAVAEQELARARQEVVYLKQRLDAERYLFRKDQAMAESAKAQSMSAAGVRPPKFDAQRYEGQAQERDALAQSAVQKAEAERGALESIERSLAIAQAALDKARTSSASPARTEDPAPPPFGEEPTAVDPDESGAPEAPPGEGMEENPDDADEVDAEDASDSEED